MLKFTFAFGLQRPHFKKSQVTVDSIYIKQVAVEQVRKFIIKRNENFYLFKLDVITYLNDKVNEMNRC